MIRLQWHKNVFNNEEKSAVADRFIRNVKTKDLQTYDSCVKKCSFWRGRWYYW